MVVRRIKIACVLVMLNQAEGMPANAIRIGANTCVRYHILMHRAYPALNTSLLNGTFGAMVAAATDTVARTEASTNALKQSFKQMLEQCNFVPSGPNEEVDTYVLRHGPRTDRLTTARIVDGFHQKQLASLDLNKVPPAPAGKKRARADLTRPKKQKSLVNDAPSKGSYAILILQGAEGMPRNEIHITEDTCTRYQQLMGWPLNTLREAVEKGLFTTAYNEVRDDPLPRPGSQDRLRRTFQRQLQMHGMRYKGDAQGVPVYVMKQGDARNAITLERLHEGFHQERERGDP